MPQPSARYLAAARAQGATHAHRPLNRQPSLTASLPANLLNSRNDTSDFTWRRRQIRLLSASKYVTTTHFIHLLVLTSRHVGIGGVDAAGLAPVRHLLRVGPHSCILSHRYRRRQLLPSMPPTLTSCSVVSRPARPASSLPNADRRRNSAPFRADSCPFSCRKGALSSAPARPYTARDGGEETQATAATVAQPLRRCPLLVATQALLSRARYLFLHLEIPRRAYRSVTTALSCYGPLLPYVVPGSAHAFGRMRRLSISRFNSCGGSSKFSTRRVFVQRS